MMCFRVTVTNILRKLPFSITLAPYTTALSPAKDVTCRPAITAPGEPATRSLIQEFVTLSNDGFFF